SPYLIPGVEDFIRKSDRPVMPLFPKLVSGNMARDDGNLILEVEQERKLLSEFPEASTIVRPLIGTTEIRNGTRRACLWIDDDQVDFAVSLPPVKDRLEKTRDFRAKSKAKTTVGYAKIPHRFAQR